MSDAQLKSRSAAMLRDSKERQATYMKAMQKRESCWFSQVYGGHHEHRRQMPSTLPCTKPIADLLAVEGGPELVRRS